MVRGAATTLLSYLIDPKYKPIFEKGMNSGSNSVKIASIIGLLAYDPSKVTDYIDKIDLNQLNFDQILYIQKMRNIWKPLYSLLLFTHLCKTKMKKIS